jgi:hypothetical protein
MHGSLDQGAQIRLTLLTYLSRLVWVLLAIGFVDFICDHLWAHNDRGWLSTGYHRYIEDSMIHLHRVTWIFILLLGVYLSRVIRETRRALVRAAH